MIPNKKISKSILFNAFLIPCKLTMFSHPSPRSCLRFIPTIAFYPLHIFRELISPIKVRAYTLPQNICVVRGTLTRLKLRAVAFLISQISGKILFELGGRRDRKRTRRYLPFERFLTCIRAAGREIGVLKRADAGRISSAYIAAD